jgi:Putative metallopeptidase
MRIYQLLFVLGCFAWGLSLAQNRGSFIVSYEDAASQVQLEYARYLQQQAFLESLVKDLNKNIALPYDIGVVAAPCDQPNAYWAPEQKTLVVCYELFEQLSEAFRSSAKSDQDLLDSVFGAVEFVFYHELGHALIDTFDIPFTGRQEDAVDQFSSIILMSQGKASSAFSGASYFFITGQSGSNTPFWDEHSLDQQRFYDIVCLVYGSDPQTYDNLLLREKGFGLGGSEGYLPKQRAAKCPQDYKDISSSWDRLISAYVPAVGGSTETAIVPDTEPTVSLDNAAQTENYTESFSGRLAQGDQRLSEGQFFDIYEVELVQGQEVTFELSSTDFDTYLVVTGPNQDTYFNDDALIKVDGYFSTLTIPISQTGTYLVGASSYAADETGNYNVGLIKTDGVYNQIFSEKLERGDQTYQSGEYFDGYEYTFEKGQRVSVVLSSLEFDSYLIVTSPSGESTDNDDFEDQFGLSRLDFEAKESGTYTVSVSSYEAGEVGSYQLAVSDGIKDIAVAGSDLTKAIGQGSTLGQLGTGDEALNDGSLVDYYTLSIKKGQVINVSVVSADFQTYIGLIKPSGEILEANTTEDTRYSSLSVNADEEGLWYVIVTSASPGQVGNYLLSINP